MEKLQDKIKKQIIKVLDKIVHGEKNRVFRLSEVSLYPSEVHLMLMISNEIDTNATEIAKMIGLTKGAISQTVSRLEKKGIISKKKDPYNKNELNLSLTDLGKKTADFCQSIQQSFLDAHDEYLSKLNSKEKEVVLNFLVHLEKTIDELK